MRHDARRERALILYPSMVSDPSQGPPRTVDWRQWTDWGALGGYAVLGIALWWQSVSIGFMVLPVLLHQLLIESTIGRATSGRGLRALHHLSALAPLALILTVGSIRPEWLVPARDRALVTAGQAVWATGCVMGFASLRYLYRAASLHGPSLITERPPFYRAYVLTLAGLWLCHPTLPFAALVAVWLVTLAIRGHYEARASRATAQELGEWHSQVEALGPRLASLIGAQERAATHAPTEGTPEQAALPAPNAAVPATEPATAGANVVARLELPSDRRDDQPPAGRNGARSSGEHTGGNGAGAAAPDRGRARRQPMRRPRIDRIVPGVGRLSVTPMVHCASSCTVEITSGGRRRRRHAESCEVVRRSQTIDRLVERGHLDVLRAIKTGALTIDEVHAAHEAGTLA